MKIAKWFLDICSASALACSGLLLILSGCTDTVDDPNALRTVPRDRTLILGFGPSDQNYDSFNPFMPGTPTGTGVDVLFEPLYFYNAYRDSNNIIPWLATGHQYDDEFTQVTVHLRQGVTWSDGMPWSAHDLAFTIHLLKSNAPMLSFSTDMDIWVDTVEVVDSLTAKIHLKAPNPRFMFSYFTYNFGNGIHIVPRHVWDGQQVDTFKNYDPAKGWPVGTGPYTLASVTPQQRIWDRRDDWWAATTGFQDPPAVERVIYLANGDEPKWVQMILTNQMDSSVDLRPANIIALLDQNPNVTTWTGRTPPYGYRDWWPPSLGFNVLEPPFDDANVRWAINHALDREELVEIGQQQAGESSLLPFPAFAPLRTYLSEVDDLLERYPVGLHDPDRSADLMRASGWLRREDGLWMKDGQRVRIVLEGYPGLFLDIAPIMVQQMRNAGFDASFRFTSDAVTRIARGTARAFINGNGGSVRDPYFTLRLYHSRYVSPTGVAAASYWRWGNPEFDAVVDEMGQISPEDPRTVRLFRQAMEIWLGELPSIPLVQWFHRVAQNQTYWTNWPSAEDPYMNSAFWVRSWLIVLLALEPAQAAPSR
ncbi:MAG: ABC transporter substrate-binding protein [Gemmatimonadetes bacterium]|jgi:peptide/nickel transport system substrate-binding protein|nr:ABC transporter substrate-binding protein [Gemmatimonadota bacterium]